MMEKMDAITLILYRINIKKKQKCMLKNCDICDQSFDNYGHCDKYDHQMVLMP